VTQTYKAAKICDVHAWCMKHQPSLQIPR